MKVQSQPPLHLTYCLNVHPGRSWAENFAAIREHARAVRDAVAGPGSPWAAGPFGLGMRLGQQAAVELSDSARIEEFRRFLEDERLYVFTINGFPYGDFHDVPVKERVYSPDWRSPQRRDYTVLLADILAQLLPAGVAGSISTVPGAYRAWIRSGADVAAMVGNLCDTALHLRDLAARTGRTIVLALEPEPDCFLETTDEVVGFFNGPLATLGPAHLAARDLTADQAQNVIRRHLGVCLDTAHAAVEFEDPAEAAAKLQRAGILIAKVQLSSALACATGPDTVKQLEAFADRVYLHQVKARQADGSLKSFPDLPAALQSRSGPNASAPGNAAEDWRVHFHVPLFFEGSGALRSTSHLLVGEFAAAIRAGLCPALEIETYTFNVLPEPLRLGGVADSIAREYRWTLARILGK